MRLFNIFKKKKKVYPDELQDCLDRLEQLRKYLEMSSDSSDYDEAVSGTLEMLAEEVIWWQAKAEAELIRFRTATVTSSFGRVKVK